MHRQASYLCKLVERTKLNTENKTKEVTNNCPVTRTYRGTFSWDSVSIFKLSFKK